MIPQRVYHLVVGILGGGMIVAFAMASLASVGGLS